MPKVNFQRLADLGQLPKSFIKNKLWQKNLDVNKEKVLKLEAENRELKAQLNKQNEIDNRLPLIKNKLKSNSKSDKGFEEVDILDSKK